jgi:hypothetical protein
LGQQQTSPAKNLMRVKCHERHSAYPQPSEGRSSHYEATCDYLNSRCVFYKEGPKPATYGAP